MRVGPGSEIGLWGRSDDWRRRWPGGRRRRQPGGPWEGIAANRSFHFLGRNRWNTNKHKQLKNTANFRLVQRLLSKGSFTMLSSEDFNYNWFPHLLHSFCDTAILFFAQIFIEFYGTIFTFWFIRTLTNSHKHVFSQMRNVFRNICYRTTDDVCTACKNMNAT